MANLLDGCLAVELGALTLSDCPENFGQVQRVLFSHVYDSTGAKNKFEPNKAVSPTTPALAADWATQLGAADETKPTYSPYLAEPVSEAGAERTFGGGNATRNGVLLSLGREPQNFDCKILSANQLDAIKGMKLFQQGSGAGKTSIGVYLINEAGQIMCDTNGLALDAVGLEAYPVPIHKLFVGDRTLGGLESPDWNMLSWQFAPNWSDNLAVYDPTDFDALVDLVNT
jgi:hypothetical protein